MKVFTKIVIVACLFCGTTFSQRRETAQSVQGQQAVQYWIGDGGKGKSITIYALQPVGLEAQSQLSEFIQADLVSVFSTYSAISVLDWESLDNILVKLTHSVYDENAEAVKDIGRFTPTTHYLTGKITKTGLGCHLEISITRTVDKMIAASHSERLTCVTNNLGALDSLAKKGTDMPLLPVEVFELLKNRGVATMKKEIRLASLELLQNMGVTLTEKGLIELTGEVVAEEWTANTALIAYSAAQQKAIADQKQETHNKNIATFERQIAKIEAKIQVSKNQTTATKEPTDTHAKADSQLVVLERLERVVGEQCVGRRSDRCGDAMFALGRNYYYQDHKRAGHEMKPVCPIIDHGKTHKVYQRLSREYPALYKQRSEKQMLTCPLCEARVDGQKQ